MTNPIVSQERPANAAEPAPVSDPQLWHRLQAWRHGNGGQRLEYLLIRKLEIHHRNQPLVIDETLRFAYLAARQDGDATPPPLLGGVLAALRRVAGAQGRTRLSFFSMP